MDLNLLPSYLAQSSYLLMLLAFSIRDLKWLRCFAMASSVAAIYYASTQPEILWTPILWNSLFLFVNFLHLGLDIWSRRKQALDPLEQFLSKTVLANFPAHEVKSFAKFAQEGEVDAGVQLIKANSEIQHLFCILQGHVEIFSKGKKVAELKPGRFVGEMSFLTKAKTRADVVALEKLKILAWPVADIDAWVGEDPIRLGLLQTALGTQIVEELLRQQDEKLETVA